jgi:riboflavin kinase/FMN adenylyltransferase
LEEWGPVYGFNVEEVAPLSVGMIHESSIPVSSSKIRKALQNDDLQTANNYLGYQFFIHAKVIHGMKLGGKELGYPTANLQIDFENKIVPSDGIYAVYVSILNPQYPIPNTQYSQYKGMMSIGTNPTIENKGRSMEVHIFDFNKDIYRQTIKVSFFKKIRNEEKFNSLEELKKQLDRDKEVCLALL